MRDSRRAFLKAAVAGVAGSVVGCPDEDALAVPDDAERAWWSIRQVHEVLRRGEASSIEITEFMLKRIETLDARLQSYLTMMADEALKAAKQADERTRRGASRGLLDGVPVAVKDLCYVKGVKTTNATTVLADFIPAYDGTVVARLKQAGAVILGKLNQTEGAMVGYSPTLPYPLNPWNAERWPGVSSSGSGVAAAAGLAYGTIGTDTGGSIRYPAAACGVVGLKPTWGRVSRHGVFALAESLDHVGPLARSTEDCAIILEAIAGHDMKDATSLPLPAPMITQYLGRGVGGLELGWDEDFGGDEINPELLTALKAAVEILKELGAKVRRVKVPSLRGYQKTWNTLCAAEAVVAHSQFYPERRKEYGPWFREWLDFGNKVTGSDYAKAVHQRNECTGKINRLFQEIDILICPAMLGPAFKVTRDDQYGPIPEGWLDGDYVRTVGVFNFSGSPTLSLPCGFNKDGLPLSMQLVGRLRQEESLCRIGHAFEQVTSYHKQHPNLG